ncbi:nicotinate-nucleotide--dimethylbenzimidazole phosphoribosyltransferase [Tianweitania sediminis]|uniref:Nicotinate-nucleotide--dimethylbenzimidazole phosphoribosyltransferase n=1 Tax=Tianweitania sediminis TaxID=1502156 RepID=A0A8J7R7S6_9HYPH|nr:nicotinate-nucleotide--dimethylbenzimidazole phosphoribosyltransferase [Tianweitania sediminis]MBP0439722.1 nicotinate-nucleotide--dimethylbenzimidazole phosphoribosyltransferase [Tianweitania sediminis]
MTSALPFDDFRSLVQRLPEANDFAGNRVRERLRELGSPGEGLGKIGDLAEWLATWSSRPAQVNRPLVAIFAGTHGVMKQGVARERLEATAATVEHLAAGGAAVSQICGANDLGLKVFDLALDMPTEDLSTGAAFDERGCAATMAFGMEAVAGGFDLVALSATGVGGDFATATVLTALWGGAPSTWISTEDDKLASRQADVIDQALRFHGAGNLRDPFEILRRVGGREVAALVGAIIAARSERIPVILDGYPALAAAALLQAGNPAAVDHCQVASTMGTLAGRAILDRLGMQPILGLNVSQAGVGAGLATLVVRTAAQVVSGLRAMPTPN